MSSFIHPANSGGPDVLRHECIDLLRNYVPCRGPKQWRFNPNSSGTTDIAKAKEKFQRKNEKYVNALKGVMEVSKQAAKQRNSKAFANFLQNLATERPAAKTLDLSPQTSIKRATSRARSSKHCKKEPETQELDSYQPQVYEPPSFYYPLPHLNPSLPSNQLESINSQMSFCQEPISSAFYFSHGFQPASSFYCSLPRLAEETANEPNFLPQQSMLTHADNVLQPTQQVDETNSSQEDQFELSNYFYVC